MIVLGNITSVSTLTIIVIAEDEGPSSIESPCSSANTSPMVCTRPVVKQDAYRDSLHTVRRSWLPFRGLVTQSTIIVAWCLGYQQALARVSLSCAPFYPYATSYLFPTACLFLPSPHTRALLSAP